MSAKEQDPVRSLAERIATRLAQGDAPENSSPAAGRASGANVGDELAALRASVSEIGQRLTQIESHVTGNDAPRSRNARHDGEARRTPQPQPQQQQQWPAQTSSPQPQQRPAQTSSPQPVRASSPPDANPAHWLSGTYVPAVHPSEERFGIDEAVSELVEFFEREKVCNVEPGGKPCDHCGMCSSRGF